MNSDEQNALLNGCHGHGEVRCVSGNKLNAENLGSWLFSVRGGPAPKPSTQSADHDKSAYRVLRLCGGFNHGLHSGQDIIRQMALDVMAIP